MIFFILVQSWNGWERDSGESREGDRGRRGIKVRKKKITDSIEIIVF
jgi:hypothetical protein